MKIYHCKSSPKFKWWDITCFGGWLVIQYRPNIVVWWSNDATPPTKQKGLENKGIWIIGNHWKWAKEL